MRRPKRFKIDYTLEIDDFTDPLLFKDLAKGEDHIEVTADANVSPGYPATGPSYSCGGEPADPPEIDDILVLLDKSDKCVFDSLIEKTQERISDLLMEDSAGWEPDYLEDDRDR